MFYSPCKLKVEEKPIRFILAKNMQSFIFNSLPNTHNMHRRRCMTQDFIFIFHLEYKVIVLVLCSVMFKGNVNI